MLWKFFSLLLLLVVVPSPVAAQAPEQLRCIYDGATDEMRDEIGRGAWANGSFEVPDSLIPIGQACYRRYGWDRESVEAAVRFAVASSGLRYLRARLAELHIAVDSWDAAYDAAPVAIRIGTSAEGVDVSSLENAAMAAIAADPNAHNDPDIVTHSAAFFGMRALVERSERDWARLHPPR